MSNSPQALTTQIRELWSQSIGNRELRFDRQVLDEGSSRGSDDGHIAEFLILKIRQHRNVLAMESHPLSNVTQLQSKNWSVSLCPPTPTAGKMFIQVAQTVSMQQLIDGAHDKHYFADKTKADKCY